MMAAVLTVTILKIVIFVTEVILITKILEELVNKDMNQIQVSQNEYRQVYQILLAHLR